MVHKTVLITGAAGFIGSRLVARLVLGTDHKVQAMVRRFSGPGLARIARLPVRLVLADVLDLASLTRAAENCDIIIHCAFGSSGDENQRRKITVSGTENVLKAAVQANVDKVIYLSTALVHGRSPQKALVDESMPFENGRYAYEKAKVEAEKIVWRYHQEHNLPVVVFRPTFVYGPYDELWLGHMIKEIQTGAMLIDGGRGAASLLYIDNLVDAILLAMEKDAGDGEAFILVDDERLSWRDVYQCYGDRIGSHPPFRNVSRAEIEAIRRAIEPSTFAKWFVVPLLVGPEMMRYALKSPEIRLKIGEIPWMKPVIQRLPRQLKDRAAGNTENRENGLNGAIESNNTVLPLKETVELYASQSYFSNEKVKRVLGYTQRISFEEAVNLNCSWLQYQRLIP